MTQSSLQASLKVYFSKEAIFKVVDILLALKSKIVSSASAVFYHYRTYLAGSYVSRFLFFMLIFKSYLRPSFASRLTLCDQRNSRGVC